MTFWMVITAFFSLPPDSVGLKGWFKSCSVHDMEQISMLPKIKYAHVRKTALLTTGGNLIVDPSVLDSRFSYEVLSLNFHKKPAYKLAFTVRFTYLGFPGCRVGAETGGETMHNRI